MKIHSIKTKIMLMTTCALLVVILIATVSGVFVIRRVGNGSAQQMLLLLCESGEKNLDHYFESVEQSVAMVSAYVESDLDGLDDARLQAHLDRVSDIFRKLTYKTNGVLTYYYRIDPTVSAAARGFWFVNLNGDGFQEHEVTDITFTTRTTPAHSSGSPCPRPRASPSGCRPISPTTSACASFPTTCRSILKAGSSA